MTIFLILQSVGDWNVKYPYDSFPAFERAYSNEADTVKGDFRVCKENVGMIMHSSPIEWYESVPCWKKKVEEMTVAECESCRMAASPYNFTSSPEVLAWSGEKVNFMFCVKESSDIPRAIDSMIEYNSTHRAFLELSLGNLLTTYNNKVKNWDQVYYIVELGTTADVHTLLSMPEDLRTRAFLYEFNNWSTWATPLADDLDAVRAAGYRSVAATRANPFTATVKNHLDIFNAGFDVAYSYNLTNAVTARKIINTERGNFPA